MTNTKNTKRALLMSGLALLMCVSMLIGSTFAWFTDSVTSAGNIIKSGTLDVTMEWLDGTVAPADDAAWIDASEGAIFDYDLWEPGYTEVRHIKIANEGTLALKYQLHIVANGEVSKLADVIDVYYIAPATQITDRAQLTDTNRIGTLTEVLADLNGKATATMGNLVAGDEQTITLALKMQESAGNEYQGLSIGSDFSIMLFATQYTSESDSFNDQYDAGAELPVVATVDSQEELAAAISGGADTIYLADGTYTLPTSKNDEFTLIGNGETVIDLTRATGQNLSGTDITFENLTVKGSNSDYIGIQHAGEIVYNNVVFEESTTLYGESVTFSDCTFNLSTRYIWTYGAKEVNFNNCLFNTDGKAVLVYAEGGIDSQVVNFTDCTFAATATATTSAGDKCAAVEIDGSLINGTYTVNFNGTNTVSDKFNGLYRIKAQKDPANVTVNQNGTVVTAETVVVEAPADLDAAIAGGADTVILGSGNYIIPDSAQGKTLTIVGNGNTVVATQEDGSYEGCDYSLQGSTVTFENITISTDSSTYTGYARLNATYNNCTINGTYTLYGDSVFNNCTFNVSGDAYNIWTWGAPNATFDGCTFNSDGKALLLYGTVDTKLTVNNCVFNDNGGLTDLKAAIEIGNDYGKSYTLTVNDTVVNGYEINDKGINTGSTLWANKNSMGTDKLNVVIDGVDVY